MIEYLVHDLGLDVNEKDTESKMSNHWADATVMQPVPTAIVKSSCASCSSAVQILTSKDCWGIHDAFGMAEYTDHSRMIEMMRESKI